MTQLQKAWELFEQGEFSQSEELYLECLKKCQKEENISSILMGLIYVDCFLEKYDQARNYARQLLKLAGNDEELHIALHQSGMVERMAGNYEQALKFFSEELDVIEKSFADDVMKKAVNLYEFGDVYLKQNKLNEAFDKMNESLYYAEQSKDGMTIACAYRGLGDIAIANQLDSDATTFFEKSIAYFLSVGEERGAQEVRDRMNNIN